MAIYTLKSSGNKVALELLKELAFWVRDREEKAVLELDGGAPQNIWDMGTKMWEPGTKHLPSKWTSEIVPKDIGLNDIPYHNAYRAIVEQIQGALVGSLPDVEIAYVDEGEAGDLGLELTDRWHGLAAHSRLLGELDLSVQHNCNYASAWVGIHKGKNGKYSIRTVHPQIVFINPDAERIDDIDAVVKLILVPSDHPADLAQISGVKWPDTILKLSTNSELQVEIWIRKGATVADRDYDETGYHGVLKGNGDIVEEEDWPFDFLPLVPFYLIPSETLIGTSLATMLWEAQVTIDKIKAVYLGRLSRSAGEKYAIGTANASAAPGSPGLAVTSRGEDDLKRAGVQVVTVDGQVTQLPLVPAPTDILACYRAAIEDLERLAGITDVFQGIQTKGSPSGVVINQLTQNSSRRVNRMATHMAEALRYLVRVWAVMELHRMGIEVDDPEEIKVTVALTAIEEKTRRTQFEAIGQLLNAKVAIPPEMLVELIPNITKEKRKELVEQFKQQAAIQHEMAMEQKAAPQLMPNAQEDGAGSPELGLPESPMPGSEEALMSEGALAPLPAADETINSL